MSMKKLILISIGVWIVSTFCLINLLGELTDSWCKAEKDPSTFCRMLKVKEGKE